jgi:hypothetical protein
MVLPTKFQLIWPNAFREDFLKLANHKQELPMAAMEILYRLSSFKGYDFFKNRPSRNKNCLWQPNMAAIGNSCFC